MKDKGFTLVELLAVIALLAILVIIAIPNVLGMFNKAKKDSFITEARTIYSTANTSFVKDSMGDMTQYVNGIDYGRSKGLALSGPSFKYLDLSGSDDIDFYVHLSLSGKVTAFYVTNGQFQFAYEGTGLDIEDISSDTVESTVGLSEEQLVSIKDNTVYVGGAPHDMLKLCVVNDKKYDVLKEYYYYSRGMNVNDWNNSSYNTSHYILNGFVNTDNNYNIVNDSAGLEDSSKGCYYPKMNNVCVMSGYASETISGDTMNRVKTTFEAPEGVTVIAYNSSIFKKMNINYSEFLQKNGLFTTSSSDTDKLFYANSGCYFNGERITSGTQVTVYPNNNSSIKCYSNQTVGECMQNSSIPGQATYYGSLGVSYGHNYAVSAMLLVRDGQKYYSAYGLICLDGESIVEVYDKKKKKKVKKKLKDVTYDDLILCWDFDLGKYTYQKPVWIMKHKQVKECLVLHFSDGSFLKVAGDHRIYNLDKELFTKCTSEDTPIGMRTINSNNEVITLVKKEKVKENITICNVVTYKDINIYANGILTSRGSNNLYKIHDMKFVKDDRETLSREDLPDISNDIFYGLRIGERDIKVYGSKENAIKELKDFAEELEEIKK